MTTVFLSHPQNKLEHYFGAKALQALQAIATVRLNPHAHELSAQELMGAAQGCDALIAYRQTPGTEGLFRSLPQLAAFIRCAVDIRTVDVEAASAHGVLVTQASAGYVPAVSEWVIATMLDLGRGISRYAQAYHLAAPKLPSLLSADATASTPAPALAPFMGKELRGATLGIIGYGQIGQYLSALALAFGMRVLVNTPQVLAHSDNKVHAVGMPQLLGESDFVVCLAPANVQTHNMMNAPAFAAMQRGAFFINAARGELVDEAALLQALESGHLAGCAVDVGRAPDQMPLPALAAHPLVLATPHIGGLTQPAIEHQALETVSQLAALCHGQMPVGAVNAAHATRLLRWQAWGNGGNGGNGENREGLAV